ncbi:hypothetical protein PYCCODRAFT_1421218 [Trametes coccinea BRFM310]|uniref:Tyrosine specific protein phosphatases domain-containing protein n=1 Tax=Trametes coccinea (strain BRFM310) TaxID=1353009 RepID=A0A1Y2J5Y9_TRAC3|nr:hypothetical protein PYCCODRAFT_1421218 [Trametes coccinea BRFM310]
MGITSFLVPMIDPCVVASTLCSPPFISIEGAFNARDFGAGCRVSDSAARVRPRRLYRAGELSRMTARGVEQLRALGVNTVFDLRTDDECARMDTEMKHLGGLEIVRLPITQHAKFRSHPRNIHRLKGFAENELNAFLEAYTTILKCNSSCLERVLLHLRDRPLEPCVIHCTAGKDRTGVFAAAILMPVVPMFAMRFQREAVFRDNWTGTLNMGSSRPETMRAFLGHVRREYGGIETFLRKHTSLTDDDFRRIRENLLI